MSQNTADNKDSFDIDFSDLSVQEASKDSVKSNGLDTGLSAEDLNFLESLSQLPDKKPVSVEAKLSESPEAETSKTVLHPSLIEPKAPAEPKIDNIISGEEVNDKGENNTIGQKPMNDKDLEALIPPASKKSGLFGGKDKGKKGKKDDSPFAKAPSKKPAGKKDLKKQLTLILGAMGVILVLGLLWVFLGKSEEPAPAPEPTPIETQAPAPEPTPEATETPVDTAGTAEGTTAENTATPAPTGDFAPIDADAIVQAEIPDDPALIKEEIDRLADENSRLLDQAKDIDGILSDTEKLTSAKEEQIALLEAQIAQLEAQKGK